MLNGHVCRRHLMCCMLVLMHLLCVLMLLLLVVMLKVLVLLLLTRGLVVVMVMLLLVVVRVLRLQHWRLSLAVQGDRRVTGRGGGRRCDGANNTGRLLLQLARSLLLLLVVT
mmetsp:Transcript_17082/g.42166  ORF Transcript_17082/g.42166 Transcript_17082/m.42166 type:complete len:112 (+) Transcript_17082:1304-1639(+)